MTIEENKNNVYQAVKKACEKANRSSDEVNIIAVTKYVSSDVAEELVKTGIKHIAENRVDKFLDKYQALKNYDLTWHLIGTLQRRKVKDVINLVDYFHALDSVNLAEEFKSVPTTPLIASYKLTFQVRSQNMVLHLKNLILF